MRATVSLGTPSIPRQSIAQLKRDLRTLVRWKQEVINSSRLYQTAVIPESGVSAYPVTKDVREDNSSSWMAELQDRNTPSWLIQAARLIPFLVALSVAIAATRAFFSGEPWMIFFEDDFFYYLKVAQNLAHGSGSTFNGIVPTNGYHPLWLLLLTAFSFFSNSPYAIFWFVASVCLVSTLATFFLARKVLEQMGANFVLRQGLAGYLAIYALHLFYTGMEIILAIPLMFLVMVMAERRAYWQGGLWPACTLGLAVSAMVLARLDLILLAALLLFWAFVNKEIRRSLTATQLTGIALGLVPLAAYLIINQHFFGIWLPVSGMAKQLKFNHLPSLRPWLTVYAPNVNHWFNIVPIHVAILVLPFVWKRLSPTQRVLFPSVLLFPFAYALLLSCVSDWQLWLWYLYPLRAALCVTFVLFGIWPTTARLMRCKAFAVVILLVIVAEVAVSKWWTDVQPSIYAAAVDVQQFAQTHPGRYAMGDRSGMVAYLIPNQVVQTEGLVMDRVYLERIRRQEPLLPALADYHVRYYVGTAWAPYTGCFQAVEPFQAGKTSAHMEGNLCQPPLASFQHERFRTMIFDLDKEMLNER